MGLCAEVDLKGLCELHVKRAVEEDPRKYDWVCPTRVVLHKKVAQGCRSWGRYSSMPRGHKSEPWKNTWVDVRYLVPRGNRLRRGRPSLV